MSVAYGHHEHARTGYRASRVGWIGKLARGLRRALEAYSERRINRAAFDTMLELDDRMLNDIGVSRHDVRWASNLPLSVNAAMELEQIARARKHSQYKL